MVAGERLRVWIPGKPAHDNRNRPGTPHGMLVFDIELLNFKEPALKNPFPEFSRIKNAEIDSRFSACCKRAETCRMAAYPRTAGSAQPNSPCPGNPSRSHRHAQAETCPVRRLYCLAGDCRRISGAIRRPAGRSERLRHKIMTAWMPGENPNRCVTTACPRASSAGRRPAQPAIEGTFSRAALSGAPAAA